MKDEQQMKEIAALALAQGFSDGPEIAKYIFKGVALGMQIALDIENYSTEKAKEQLSRQKEKLSEGMSLIDYEEIIAKLHSTEVTL